MQSRKPSGRLRIKLEPATCDQCHLEKVPCQAPESVDERCGQCEHQHVPCLWTIGPRPSGRSPPSPSYVTYLESRVSNLERRLREILPGVNLNRELESLAQIAPQPRAPRAVIHPNPSQSSSPSQASSSIASPPSRRAQDIPSHGVHAAPQLLHRVRLASDVRVESTLPFDHQPSHHPTQQDRPLRVDAYWSETASTRAKEPRFHGQSSGEILLRDAKEFKQEFVELSLSAYGGESGQDSGAQPSSSSYRQSVTYPLHGPPSRAIAPIPVTRTKPQGIHQRRPQFWQPTRSEQRAIGRDILLSTPVVSSGVSSELLPDEFVLPPPDLLRSLIVLFFDYVNPFFPLFHQQAFEQELARGTHLLEVLQRRTRDEKQWVADAEKGYGIAEYFDAGIDQTRGAGPFARVVLLVCACASRWSGDPRVLSSAAKENLGSGGSGGIDGLNPLSAGYGFFRQVVPWSRIMCAQAGLWDVQIFILSCLFLHGSSAHSGAWIVLGIGIRLAQDVGAHRKKDERSIENELFKRAFWSLLVLDRLMSGTLGRPSAMQDLDSDLENLLEVDDEHWPVGGEPNQPPNKPSRLAFFNRMIGLSRVLGRALQTVFAINRTKQQMGLVGHEKEEMLLRDLQHHMKQWQFTVPPHLRLPRLDKFVPSLFLDQAVSLWATYYNIMILIHRPFITIKSSPLTGECLEVCRSSARACANIAEGQIKLSESELLPSTIQAVFSSGMVLIIDILATKNAEKQDALAGGGVDSGRRWFVTDSYSTLQKEQDVERCMRVLERAETRWHIAGRLHDMLQEFQRSGRLLTPDSASRPPRVGPLLGTAPSSAPPWASARGQPTATPVIPLAPRASDTVSFDLDPAPAGNTSTAAGARQGPSHRMASGPPIHVTPAPSYESYHNPTTYIGQATAHPFDPPVTLPPYNQPNNKQPHPTDFVHPGPTDPYRFDVGAYIPDAFYGDDLNVPFPGIVPQLSFAPNDGREVPVWPPNSNMQNPGWPNYEPRPTPASQWELLMSNTMDLAGGSQPLG